MKGLQTVDDASFRMEAEEAEGLVLVEFGAAWCAPCRIMTPILKQLATAHAPDLTVLSMDADENPSTAARFGVRGLPTMLFFRDGRVVDQVVGAVPRDVLEAKVEANVVRG